MQSKFILITCFLLISLKSFGQDLPQISFLHNNGIRQNSTIIINFGNFSENDSTTVYCEVYNKKFEKKILLKNYTDIINVVKKISSTDILSRDDLFLDASESTITVSNMQSSVSFTISGLHENDNRKEYFNFKNAAIKILSVIELNLSDLK